MEEKAAQLLQKAVSQISEKRAAGALDYAAVCAIALELAADVVPLEIAGSEKKRIVLDSLKAAVTEAFGKGAEGGEAAVDGTATSEIVDDWITTVLPTTLDLVIGAARGKLSALAPVVAAVSAVAVPVAMPFVQRIVAAIALVFRGCRSVSAAAAPVRAAAAPVRAAALSVPVAPKEVLPDAESTKEEPQKGEASPPNTQQSREPEPPLAQPVAAANDKEE